MIEAEHALRARFATPATAEEYLARVRRIEANPPIEQNGNSIRIGQMRDDDLYRNVSISYEVTGEGEPVVQIHGAGFGHFNFAPATPESPTG